MSIQLKKTYATANFTRFKGVASGGHYESYFMRANDAATGRAFWIRYTIFQSEKNANTKAPMGELWAVYFDKGKMPIAAKSEIPLSAISYSNTNFNLNFDGATLNDYALKGSAGNLGPNRIEWNMSLQRMPDAKDTNPILPLPLSAYDLPVPRAKLLVSQPFVMFKGTLTINGKTIAIADWQGSQNHNWGSRHTDEYAWGQVAGFDGAPDSFLEVASAKMQLGFFTTPYLTPIVVRHEGKEYALNGYWQSIRNKATVDYFDWKFWGENDALKIEGHIHADGKDVVALRYYNPPGDSKACLNTKVATCSLAVQEKGRLGLTFELTTKNRAAFEILTSKDNHGLLPLF